jgi:hypothetical protein
MVSAGGLDRLESQISDTARDEGRSACGPAAQPDQLRSPVTQHGGKLVAVLEPQLAKIAGGAPWQGIHLNPPFEV